MLKSALFYSIHTLSDLSLLLINSSDHNMTKTKVRSAKRLAFHTGVCLAGPHSCIGFGCKWIYDKIHPLTTAFIMNGRFSVVYLYHMLLCCSLHMC